MLENLLQVKAVATACFPVQYMRAGVTRKTADLTTYGAWIGWEKIAEIFIGFLIALKA